MSCPSTCQIDSFFVYFAISSTMRIADDYGVQHLRRVAFCTFGCRLNAYDTETARTLIERHGGMQTVPLHEDADVYVVNTCSVTSQADARARKAVRRLNAEHPGAQIVITGCYAQRAPEELAGLPGVSLVLGAADRAEIATEIERMVPGEARVAVSPIAEARTFLEVPITEMMERSRALVKVQEGCNESCSFCIVPQTRGRSRSRTPDRVLSQVRQLVETGYTEIVLTGVHVGAYGLDFSPGDYSLAKLIREILLVPGLERFRLSSIEPSTVSEELIELMAAEEKFARHFHVPIQSGSDEVLRHMGRGYSAEEVASLVFDIADAIPDCGIGTDVIAGFPGETEAQFQQTFDLLLELPVTYLHAFTYSVRPGSRAESLGDQVPADVKKRRTRSLKRLSQDKNRTFRERHLGRRMEVLFERDERTGGCDSGWTDNYLRVSVDTGTGTAGLQPVSIIGLNDTGLAAAMTAG